MELQHIWHSAMSHLLCNKGLKNGKSSVYACAFLMLCWLLQTLITDYLQLHWLFEVTREICWMFCQFMMASQDAFIADCEGTFPWHIIHHFNLACSAILVLSGWSDTKFSYWARRSEGISAQLQSCLRQDRVLQDLPDDDSLSSLTYRCAMYSSPNITSKGLKIMVEEIKKCTGPFVGGILPLIHLALPMATRIKDQFPIWPIFKTFVHELDNADSYCTEVFTWYGSVTSCLTNKAFLIYALYNMCFRFHDSRFSVSRIIIST